MKEFDNSIPICPSCGKQLVLDKEGQHYRCDGNCNHEPVNVSIKHKTCKICFSPKIFYNEGEVCSNPDCSSWRVKREKTQFPSHDIKIYTNNHPQFVCSLPLFNMFRDLSILNSRCYMYISCYPFLENLLKQVVQTHEIEERSRFWTSDLAQIKQDERNQYYNSSLSVLC